MTLRIEQHLEEVQEWRRHRAETQCGAIYVMQDLVVLGGGESPVTQNGGSAIPGGESKTVLTDPFPPRITEDHQGIVVDKRAGNFPKLFKLKSDINLNMLDGEASIISDENEVMY